MGEVHLCSFSDSRMSPTLARLKKQAGKMNIFSSILFFNEKDFDDDFLKTFRTQLKPSVRGYGYWVWKPYIISRALNVIKEGDILLYVDAGSHLNVKGINRFNEYLQITEESASGFLTFQLVGDTFLEKYWTKGDLLDFFNVRENVNIIDTPMRDASVLFIKKTEYSVRFIDKWLSIFKNHFSLADDSPSSSPNFEGFVEHRFDQSIFSVLAKIENLDVLSGSEIYATDWSTMDRFPIWGKKDKKIKLRYRYSLKRFLKKKFS